MIDVTGLDPLSLGDLGFVVQYLGEFGASGRARTMKIGRHIRSCSNWLDKVVFLIRPSEGLKGEGKLEKLRYFSTYERVVGSEWILYLEGPRDSELLF